MQKLSGEWGGEITSFGREIGPPEWLLFFFRLLKKEFVGLVALFLEILHGDEAEGGGVDAEPLASGSGTVWKQVSEVGIAFGGADFDAFHAVGIIFFFDDDVLFNGAGEAGPSGAGIKFVFGTEERLAGDNGDVNALAVVVPIFVFEGRFRSALGGDVVLERCEHGFLIFGKSDAGEESQHGEGWAIHDGKVARVEGVRHRKLICAGEKSRRRSHSVECGNEALRPCAGEHSRLHPVHHIPEADPVIRVRKSEASSGSRMAKSTERWS